MVFAVLLFKLLAVERKAAKTVAAVQIYVQIYVRAVGDVCFAIASERAVFCAVCVIVESAETALVVGSERELALCLVGVCGGCDEAHAVRIDAHRL